jgi:hypothetical protein
MDVHKETISIAVMNSAGKVTMESIIETKAITILQFIQGLSGEVANERYFSHIWGEAGLAGKTEGLRKAREEGRWSPPTREKQNK